MLTHDRQTFYNVVHHPLFDRDASRTIHFEGTYPNDFSGNPEKTQRHYCTQMLYRSDLHGEASFHDPRHSVRRYVTIAGESGLRKGKALPSWRRTMSKWDPEDRHEFGDGRNSRIDPGRAGAA